MNEQTKHTIWKIGDIGIDVDGEIAFINVNNEWEFVVPNQHLRACVIDRESGVDAAFRPATYAELQSAVLHLAAAVNNLDARVRKMGA